MFIFFLLTKFYKNHIILYPLIMRSDRSSECVSDKGYDAKILRCKKFIF